MRLIICLLFSLTFSGCNEKEALQNYSDEKLVDILKDVHIANALVSKSSNGIRDSLKTVFAEQLTEIHDLPPGGLDSILNLVHLDIKRYTKISLVVNDTLSQIHKVMDKEMKR